MEVVSEELHASLTTARAVAQAAETRENFEQLVEGARSLFVQHEQKIQEHEESLTAAKGKIDILVGVAQDLARQAQASAALASAHGSDAGGDPSAGTLGGRGLSFFHIVTPRVRLAKI